jgi:anionic cell wall polymer biosynthesis LytR-Cps2A-Psr (LCP) family protein
MVRQKCVMNAMLKQLDPMTVLTKFNKIAAAGKEVVATDIPTSDIATMLELSTKAKELPVASVAIVPPLIQPGDPNFQVVREAVKAKIDAAEAADAKLAEPPATPAPSPTGRAKAKKKSAAKTGQTNNLSKVCAA